MAKGINIYWNWNFVKMWYYVAILTQNSLFWKLCLILSHIVIFQKGNLNKIIETQYYGKIVQCDGFEKHKCEIMWLDFFFSLNE